MNVNKRTARIAGLLYLIVVICGIFSLAYVPSKLIVRNDAVATFNNISSSETLFRLSIVSSVVCYTAFLLLPLVLYYLLKPVNQLYARAMVLLAVVSVPISFMNLQHKYAALSVIKHNQPPSELLFFLEQYNSGILVAQVFWGLWLLPFGYLMYKSGYMPKFLGILLMMGCFGYLINFAGRTSVPNYDTSLLSSYVTLPASLGEIGTCLWLLILGIQTKKIPVQAQAVTKINTH